MSKIQNLNFGVMVTPALVVDGEVKIAGRVPKIDDIKKILLQKFDFSLHF